MFMRVCVCGYCMLPVRVCVCGCLFAPLLGSVCHAWITSPWFPIPFCSLAAHPPLRVSFCSLLPPSLCLFFYSPVILSALYFVVRLQLALNGLCSIYLIKTQFIAALTIFPLRTLAVTVICCCCCCYYFCCSSFCCLWCCCVVLFVSSFLLLFCLFPPLTLMLLLLFVLSSVLASVPLSLALSLCMCVRVFTVRFSYWLFVLSLRDINTKNHQQHQQQQQQQKEKQKKKQQQQRTKYPLDLARI